MQSHTTPSATAAPSFTVGSLFAGIGGFDLGFERAGAVTRWQVEINPVNRAVLADRFPHAERFEDVRRVGAHCLPYVDCLVGGFPCQDISVAGHSRRDKSKSGLKGERSGLFFEVLRILDEIRPGWVVLENVPALLHSNGGDDLATVVRSLAERGYVGLWRVLDARYFGVPQARRRLFMVGRLGGPAPVSLLSDAGAVEALPVSLGADVRREADAWAAHTLCATNAAGRLSAGHEVLVAHPDGWSAMADRQRAVEDHGVLRGLDEANLAEAYAAGNAVCPPVAEWIARHILAAHAGVTEFRAGP